MLYITIPLFLFSLYVLYENKKIKLSQKERESKIDERERQINELVGDKKIQIKGLEDKICDLKEQKQLFESEMFAIEQGLYSPMFDYEDEEDYVLKLKDLRYLQKCAIQDESHITCKQDWVIEGSKAKGRKLTRQYGKIMARAFNAECDALIAKVRYGNVDKFIKRLEKAYEQINKFGEMYQVTIDNRYKELKIEELHAVYEHEKLKHENKEKEKEIRAKIKQEKEEMKALQKAEKEAIADEVRLNKELEHTKVLLKTTSDNRELKAKVSELEKKLKESGEKKRKISQAMLTKAGYVYIISNPAFEHNCYKIGLTRRLNYEDRINELSGASVPFKFNVHGVIYTDNAPELESKLHKTFDDKRVNKANTRKEFFHVKLDEIKKEVEKFGHKVEFIEKPINVEWEETCKINHKIENLIKGLTK